MFAAEITALNLPELAARWRSVLVDPALDDLPDGYRVELDQFGQVIVSPRPTNRHQVLAILVCEQLRAVLGGFASAGEITVATRIGVRVPDAFWTPDLAWTLEDPVPRAPEICVEIASASNSPRWLVTKAEAYVAAGAQEVIVVAVDGGSARYFHADGEHGSSRWVQLKFPLLDSRA